MFKMRPVTLNSLGPASRVAAARLGACVRCALAVLAFSGVAGAQPADLGAASERATQAMNDGRFDEAAGLYREMLGARPNDAGLLMNLGMALAMAGREADAVEPLKRAVRLQPSLAPAQLFLGSSYLALGQPDLAVAPLERAVAATPDDPENVGLLAQAYLATGDAERAVTQFRKLSQLAPRAPAAWYGLGQAYNALAQQALESFNADPADSPWRALLVADALREDSRLNEAFGEYRALAIRMPAMRSLREAMASIYERTGHPEWAATARKQAAAIPLDCEAHRAACAFGAGEHRTVLTTTKGKADAESRYWRARAASELTRMALGKLDALPDSRERREMRAELARAQNRHADSVEEIREALRFAPDDPRLLEELATSHYLARDYQKAADVAGALLAKHPESASLLALYGEALVDLQRLDAAIPALERAIALHPTDTAARTALGRAYVMAGTFAKAIPLLEPALADDEDGSLHFQLARAYQGTGQADKAKPLLEKYQQLQQAAATRGAESTEAKITPP